ncbi:AAA family ATPase [Azospirillum sp. Sh1]|uniref:ParA family protein n=1 Tax=Azospirillum sp. Sh1 TaxID=2607285 RepID=UPI0011EDC8DF|nr:AAA family ATPase [Azospirillum sp. Sh1]KAA0573655.1 AAA family ATPase [Azospirillum sp. Sh1]
MKVVSVINFKGGVSKTTLSFHLACFLARSAKVLLVDIDHQSSLSLVVLKSKAWQGLVGEGKTINRVFESYSNRHVHMPGEEIVCKSPMQRGPAINLYPSLHLAPAQFELDDTEIDLASTFFSNPTLSDWDKRTLLATWLDSIRAGEKYDYIIFDCPPATKIVSQNALACSHGYIIPVIPDELSSRGVTHFTSLVRTKIDEKLEYLRQSARVPENITPKAYVPVTKLAAIVPSLVKSAGNAASGMTNIHTEQLAALHRQWKGAVLGTVGKHYIGVPEAMNAGMPVWNYWGSNAKRQVKNMMTNICTELKNRIDAL